MAGVVNNSGNVNKQSIIWTLETQVNESETSSFEVGEQRERNHRYYSLQAMGNERKGRSHYISPDVLDAVEGKKALFSEAFLSARDVVRFTDCYYPGEAESKTAYVNRQFKRNQYERLLRDGWHDAFVSKRLVILAEWSPETKETKTTFEGVPMQVAQQQLKQMGEVLEVDDSQLQVQTMPSPQGPMQIVMGEITVTLADGYVKLTLVQPERFFTDPDATYPDQAQWCTLEEDISRGMLIDMGYDREQVEKLSVDYRFRSDEEDAARKRHDSSWTRRRQHNRTQEQEAVSFFRTWTWLEADDEMFADLDLDFTPPDSLTLYEIHWSHGEVMKWAAEEGEPLEEKGKIHHAVSIAEEMPFFSWTEMPISHASNGLCTADVTVHSQKTTSELKRLVIDNQQMRNSSRTLALSGALKNPRDLLDNLIGATIWTRDMNAVMPLPSPELSPMTMDVLAMLKRDTEERSGLTSLAKGMNTDAIKYQNADNMIDRLTTAGQRRVAAEMRDFANTFLIPLSQYIVHLGMRNDTGTEMMESQGQQKPITPSEWKDEKLRMDAAVALTPDEGKQMAQSMMFMHQTLSTDADMKGVYGTRQKHKMLDYMFELMGVNDTSQFMLSPDSPEYAQLQQGMQQAQQKDQQKGELMFGAQLEGQKAQTQALQSQDKREWAKFQWNQTDDMEDNMLNVDQLDWDIERGRAELKIEEEQERNVSLG